MRYEKLWLEVQGSEIRDEVKKAVRIRLSDPTYSEAYIKLLVQWIKVALYAGDEYDLRMLMFGHAPRRKGKKKVDAD
jgi:hypothetical protein